MARFNLNKTNQLPIFHLLNVLNSGLAAAAVTASVAAATVMVEPIQQMEEEVESIVEKHHLEEMERVSVAPKDTEEDDIEPELQRIKVKGLLSWCLS